MSGNDFFYTLTNTNTLIIMSSLKCSMLFNDGCTNGDAAASIHLNWLSNLMALKKDTFSNIKKISREVFIFSSRRGAYLFEAMASVKELLPS